MLDSLCNLKTKFGVSIGAAGEASWLLVLLVVVLLLLFLKCFHMQSGSSLELIEAIA